MLLPIHKNASEFCECFCSMLSFLPFLLLIFPFSVCFEFLGFFPAAFSNFQIVNRKFLLMSFMGFCRHSKNKASTWSSSLFGFKSFLLANWLAFLLSSTALIYFARSSWDMKVLVKHDKKGLDDFAFLLRTKTIEFKNFFVRTLKLILEHWINSVAFYALKFD